MNILNFLVVVVVTTVQSSIMEMAELDETNTRPQYHGIMVGNDNVINRL
jgi:hypothetical protein